MKPIIVVENILKKFNLGPKVHAKYGIRNLFYEIMGHSRNSDLRESEFAAVNDISFSLYPGDSLALIGRNGCGKTTTLNMLNGTLKPDAGKIIIDGRVQALISMGAGFDPRLSGIENIINTAAVLGLNGKETKVIIDEVANFSELGEFIDSPVQTYSSGMYARLGFSVAVHLKPDILLIDEILAVGDHAFQNKCFSKMQELKEKGVTIILVSHAHTSVIQLCEQAIWLHHGKEMKFGPSKDVVKSYLKFLDDQGKAKAVKQNVASSEIEKKAEAKPPPPPKLYGPIYDDLDKIDDLKVKLYSNGCETAVIKTHDDLSLEFSFKLKYRIEDFNISLNFYRKHDGLLFTTISTLNGDIVKHIHEGEVKCKITIKDLVIAPGEYILLMPIHAGHSYLYRNIVKEFQVINDNRMTWGIIDFEYDYQVLSE